MPDHTLQYSRRLSAFDTSTLYEGAGQRGAMDPKVHALRPTFKLAGPAVTVECPPGDNLALIAAIGQLRPGQVVVARAGDSEHSVWGEVLTIAAMVRGAAGLVLEGRLRDIDAIAALGFPVFACGTTLNASAKIQPGRLNTEISCGGLRVRPGDFVVGDESGVVVLDASRIESVLEAAEARVDRERTIIESLNRGGSLLELLGLEHR